MADGFDRDWMLERSPHNGGIREVVMTEVVWDWFVKYIYARGLNLFPIPDTEGGFDYVDEIPSYGIGPGRWMTA